MVDARHERECDEETSELSLYDFACVLHKFLHLVDDPSVCVQLIMLKQCLIFFGFKDAPDVVAEASHSLVQLDLCVLIRSEVRELLRELVERLNEILDQNGQTRILAAQVSVDERGLHLSQSFEDL